jgi:hypothetical protein
MSVCAKCKHETVILVYKPPMLKQGICRGCATGLKARTALLKFVGGGWTEPSYPFGKESKIQVRSKVS